ncbi:DUF4385 domain-containing protein [Mangrovivirga cuniculi]|uniref:DUF4385 domain-containing protein n=1 Tax=Mangrovivirga cuniculi TaxID=2715131 RepID=A0A4D7JL27_9BACT|nr:DUF4385 domain-containing protein [Mangrovivirga cuniculi]QCK14200.1 DUF4385 domain-containing protein [Mangrovivirga cuniculi]
MSQLYDPDINYRKHPEKYRIGSGEKGVLTVEPYKSEILPHWKFKTPKEAKKSADKIFNLFEDYLEKNDFVGADMARKFLRMGMTRARRYARHPSGKKYDEDGNELPVELDEEKQKSSDIFKGKWEKAKENPTYQKLKDQHKEKYY